MDDILSSTKKDAFSLFFLVFAAGFLWLFTWLPFKTVFRIAVFVLMTILAYHIYLYVRRGLAKNETKSLVRKLFVIFPAEISESEIFEKTDMTSKELGRLVENGCVAKNSDGYFLGPNAPVLTMAWEMENLNRQFFLLSVTILVVSIILLALNIV